MPSKKAKANGTERLVDPDELLTEEDFEFEDFLDEVGPEISTVSIFRVLRDGTREQVDKVPLNELINDVYGWLRENCGTGKYQLYFRGADRRYRGAKTVAVGERKSANGAQLHSNGNSNNTNAHQEFLEKQFAMQQQMVTGLLAAMKGPDIGTLLSGLGSLVPKAPAQVDPAGMLTAVALVFEKLRGPQKDEDWLARAKTILDLAKTMQPDSSAEDNVWSVVRDVGKEVAHRLVPGAPGSAIATDQALATTTRTLTRTLTPIRPASVERPADVALSADVVSPVVGPSPIVAPADNATLNLPQNAEDWLRVGLGYLKEKAKLYKDPDIYLDQIFDNTEEPQWKVILASVREGATFENLMAFDSEISQNEGLRNWFRRIYDGVHTELFPPVDTGGSRRDENHVTDNAGSGAPG